MRRSRMRCIIASFLAVSALSLWFLVPVAEATTAQFSLQLASPDAVLDLSNPADQTLNLELWVTLDSAPGGLLGYSTYLKPSTDGIITFNSGSFVDQSGLGYPMIQGTDNKSTSGDALSGAFSRGLGTFPAVPFATGATKLATFSVSALSLGTVHYSFANESPSRPLSVTFGNGSIVNGTSPTDLVITVIPEPASAMLLLFACGLVIRRR